MQECDKKFIAPYSRQFAYRLFKIKQQRDEELEKNNGDILLQRTKELFVKSCQRQRPVSAGNFSRKSVEHHSVNRLRSSSAGKIRNSNHIQLELFKTEEAHRRIKLSIEEIIRKEETNKKTRPWLQSGNNADPNQKSHKLLRQNAIKYGILNKAWRRNPWPGYIKSNKTSSNDYDLTSEKNSNGKNNTVYNQIQESNNLNEHLSSNMNILPIKGSNINMAHIILTGNVIYRQNNTETTQPGILILRRNSTKSDILEAVKQQFGYETIQDLSFVVKSTYGQDSSVLHSLSHNNMEDKPHLTESTTFLLAVGKHNLFSDVVNMNKESNQLNRPNVANVAVPQSSSCIRLFDEIVDSKGTSLPANDSNTLIPYTMLSTKSQHFSKSSQLHHAHHSFSNRIQQLQQPAPAPLDKSFIKNLMDINSTAEDVLRRSLQHKSTNTNSSNNNRATAAEEANGRDPIEATATAIATASAARTAARAVLGESASLSSRSGRSSSGRSLLIAATARQQGGSVPGSYGANSSSRRAVDPSAAPASSNVFEDQLTQHTVSQVEGNLTGASAAAAARNTSRSQPMSRPPAPAVMKQQPLAAVSPVVDMEAPHFLASRQRAPAPQQPPPTARSHSGTIGTSGREDIRRRPCVFQIDLSTLLTG